MESIWLRRQQEQGSPATALEGTPKFHRDATTGRRGSKSPARAARSSFKARASLKSIKNLAREAKASAKAAKESYKPSVKETNDKNLNETEGAMSIRNVYYNC